MNTGWQTETGSLERRWSALLDRQQYNPAWLERESSEASDSTLPSTPDFAAHSALGSGEWFVPWNARWSLPTR
jgi:hypothetical protein